MGKTNDGNGRDASSVIVPLEPIEYVLGGIRLAMNATPVLLIQGQEFESTGGWARHPQAVAVFAAAAMEIVQLRTELDELRTQIAGLEAVLLEEVGVPAEIGSVEGEHIELDPEEAERDYQERLRKVRSYLSKMGWKPNVIPRFAGIERIPALDPESERRPSAVELRKIEAWLDTRGGSEWSAWNG